GGFQLGDIKFNSVLDITPIIMEVPLASRGDLGRIGQLPVPTQMGTTIPLSELGEFVKSDQDPIIYHKDLRSVEYVTAETVGDLAAPIYGMMEVGDLLEGYRAPDGVALSGEMIGPPDDDFKSGFEWTGEWTVTYETFRDMGIAFGVALVLIYMLVVWEFGNFVLPAIVMAPIPLTLVGIVPGHWLLNAEFTATSMIGFIALAGIIVRNSILLVDFSKHQIERGMPVLDALVYACQVRTRPIVITALALVGGSSVILFDPIFQGMAVSLLFGVLVSTALTLFIIPLGCYSARSAFKTLSQAAPADGAGGEGQAGDPTVAGAGNDSKKSGALMSKVSAVFGLLGMLLLDIFKSAFAALWGFAASGAKALLNRFKARPRRVASVDEPQGAASEDRDQRVSDERPMAEALSAIEKEIVSHDIPASASEPPSASGASDGKAVDRETGDGGPDLDTPIAESPVAVEAASRNDEKAVVVAADQDAFPTDSGEAISTPDEAQPRPGSEREKPLVEKSDDDANADVVVAVPPKAPIEETESDPPVNAATSTAKPRAPRKQARAKVAKTAATKKKSSVKKKAATKKSAVSRKKKVTPIDEARSGEKARESSAAQEKSAASAPPKTRKKGRRGIRLKGM
ncbi:MAG TPA: AcrB/AcrD/AcrF family protein, partial [Gammaproteobacteria bacterium]|nr:AcrB/AcrD/AcrF family protein [Gammaproteobacteria bacterium]